MPRKSNPPPDDAEQAARFIETARKIEKKQPSKDFLEAISVILPEQKKTNRI